MLGDCRWQYMLDKELDCGKGEIFQGPSAFRHSGNKKQKLKANRTKSSKIKEEKALSAHEDI